MRTLIHLFALLLLLFLINEVFASGTTVRRAIVREAEKHVGEHFQGSTSGVISTVSSYSNQVSYYDTSSPTYCKGVVSRRGWKESCYLHWHFDCSGLLSYAMKRAGMYVGRRNAYDLYHKYSDYTSSSTSSLLPGDLCFRKDTYQAGVTHSAIYIGNGMVISSLSKEMGVTALTLNKWKYGLSSGSFAGCRRVKSRYWPSGDRSWEGSYVYQPDYVEVTCNSVTVREGRTTSSRALGTVLQGQRYVAQHHYGGWWKFFFDHQHAWVPDSCVVELQELSTNIPYIIVDYTRVSIYSSASSSTAVSHAHFHERFVVISSVGSYFKIYFKGSVRYIKKSSGRHIVPSS